MIYLDNAATSFPKPESVYQAMDKCHREYAANPGRSGHQLALKASREIYRTREKIGELFGIQDPMQIAFTANGTESLNLALKGVLTSGDHVIVSSMEHNSMLRPLNALKDQGISFTMVPCNCQGELDVALVEEAIRPETKLIGMTHASNVSGTLFPVAEMGELCRRRGLLYLIDAAQTAGVYPIDVRNLNCDLLAAPGHKGLLGPQGTGFLYIRKGLDLRPLKEGGTGSRSDEAVQPKLLPDRYESGTQNTPGIVGLGAGIDFILEVTLERIQRHEERLTQQLMDGLSQIGGVKLYGPGDSRKQSATVSFTLEGMDSSEAAYYLDDEYGICSRPGLHCAPYAHQALGTFETGTVRLSPGFFNTEEDIEKAVDAVKQINGKA